MPAVVLKLITDMVKSYILMLISLTSRIRQRKVADIFNRQINKCMLGIYSLEM